MQGSSRGPQGLGLMHTGEHMECASSCRKLVCRAGVWPTICAGLSKPPTPLKEGFSVVWLWSSPNWKLAFLLVDDSSSFIRRSIHIKKKKILVVLNVNLWGFGCLLNSCSRQFERCFTNYTVLSLKWQNLGNFSTRLSCLLAYTGLNPLNWLNPIWAGKSCWKGFTSCVGEEAEWDGCEAHRGFRVVSIPFQGEIVYLASPLFAGQ